MALHTQTPITQTVSYLILACWQWQGDWFLLPSSLVDFNYFPHAGTWVRLYYYCILQLHYQHWSINRPSPNPNGQKQPDGTVSKTRHSLLISLLSDDGFLILASREADGSDWLKVGLSLTLLSQSKCHTSSPVEATGTSSSINTTVWVPMILPFSISPAL